MDARNASYSMNTLKWGDGLLAGLGGTAASVNLTDRIDTALPMIQNTPQNFDAAFVDPNTETAQPDTTTPPAETTSDWLQLRQRILSILAGRGPALESDADWKGAARTGGKYILIALLALILIYIGIQILVWPITKEVVKTATKAA